VKIVPLAEAQLSFKVLISSFLLAVGIGYLFGLVHIYTDVGFSYTGVVTHYRGGVKELTLPPEFAFAKLIHHHHVHIFGLSMLFVLIGVIFTLTQLPEWAKTIFVMAPFVGLFIDLTSFWLLVFVSPLFGWFSIIFGAFMGCSFPSSITKCNTWRV
jgi:hypothetical protein